jgi:hypothetical protein
LGGATAPDFILHPFLNQSAPFPAESRMSYRVGKRSPFPKNDEI